MVKDMEEKENSTLRLIIIFAGCMVSIVVLAAVFAVLIAGPNYHVSSDNTTKKIATKTVIPTTALTAVQTVTPVKATINYDREFDSKLNECLIVMGGYLAKLGPAYSEMDLNSMKLISDKMGDDAYRYMDLLKNIKTSPKYDTLQYDTNVLLTRFAFLSSDTGLIVNDINSGDLQRAKISITNAKKSLLEISQYTDVVERDIQQLK